MHTLPSTIRFFKIVTSTNLQDGNLRIPNSFTKKHGNDMSNPIFLKTPDGKKWKMYLTKKDGDIWIDKGWKEFATHYSLGHGHMMLFHCEEKETSQFDVHIFDKSTLEIEYNIHGIHYEHNNSIENLDGQPPCKKFRKETSEDAGTSSKLQNMPKPIQVKEEINDTIEYINVKQKNQEQNQLTSKVGEALNKAKNFNSENPSFTVVMTSSYVTQYLYVPLVFEQKHLMKVKQSDIALRVSDERTWIVKYCLRRIGSGWKTFASDNNLNVGDVCVFELINSKNLTFKVLIFREEQERKVTQRNSVEASPCSTKNSEAMKEANKFASTLENAFFTINLKSSHWNVYTPRIQKAFSMKYLCGTKKFVMLQIGKKMWPVKLVSVLSEPSCRLCFGWKMFAEANKLQVGDVCVFELIDEEDVMLDVHIFRGHN